MVVFMLIAASMLAAALAFVLLPLLRGGNAHGGASAQAQRRIKALNQARAAGILNEVEYAQKRAELGDEVLRALDAPPPRSRSAFGAALAIAVLLPATAILLYRVLGEPRALDPVNLAASAQAPADHGPDMERAIAGLADKLKKNPDDAEGWTLLGRALKTTERFAEARAALKHARDLAPDNTDTMVEYAEAIALTSDTHRIEGEARTLLEQALKAEPGNQRGLWLLGISEYQDGKFDAAIATWNRLLPLLPNDSSVVQSVQQQIARARAQRDGTEAPDESEATAAPAAAPAADARSNLPASPAATAGPQLTISVSLDPILKSKLAPNDVLFVYAKAASGPPMPLAIQRLLASQLPVTVTLTDGMGMLPSMKLSQFPYVIIGARISKSGNAIAQSGDLQTLTKPIDVNFRAPIDLRIDQIVQ